MSHRRKAQKKGLKPLTKKRVKRVILIILSIVGILLFYVLAVFFEPPKEENSDEDYLVKATLPASGPVEITKIDDISYLTAIFPEAVLVMRDGQAYSLIKGQSHDAAYQGSYARIITLHYQTQKGEIFTLRSIYPPEAYELLGTEDLTLTTKKGYRLGNLPAVRMEGETMIRLHTQGRGAIFAFNGPVMSEEDLLQLLAATAFITVSNTQ